MDLEGNEDPQAWEEARSPEEVKQGLYPRPAPPPGWVLHHKLLLCSCSICAVEPISTLPWDRTPSRSQEPLSDESGVPGAQEWDSKGAQKPDVDTACPALMTL